MNRETKEPQNILGRMDGKKDGSTTRHSSAIPARAQKVHASLQFNSDSTNYDGNVVVGKCGKYTYLIDLADIHHTAGLHLGVKPDKGNFYLIGATPAQKKLRIHRLIMGSPKGMMIDHINGNGLDNRRCNLRVVSNGQNVQNRRPNRCLKYKGIAKNNSRANPWFAKIKPNGITLWLGAFPSQEAAARAYDAAALVHFGEFARLNFPIPHTTRMNPCTKMVNPEISGTSEKP